MRVGSTDEGCAAPPARGRDLILPWPVSPKHTPQKPRTLANEQAGGTVREKGCFVVNPFGREHLPDWSQEAEDAQEATEEANNDIRNVATSLDP